MIYLRYEREQWEFSGIIRIYVKLCVFSYVLHLATVRTLALTLDNTCLGEPWVIK